MTDITLTGKKLICEIKFVFRYVSATHSGLQFCEHIDEQIRLSKQEIYRWIGGPELLLIHYLTHYYVQDIFCYYIGFHLNFGQIKI